MAATGAGTTAEVPSRSVHFTVFSAVSIEGLSYRPSEKKPLSVIRFYPTARSPVYDYTGEENLRFYRLPAEALSNSNDASAVAEIKIPKGASEMLLLFAPKARTADQQTEYQIHILEESATSREPGSIQFINLSGLVLQGSVGGRRIILQQGMKRSLKFATAAKIDLRTSFGERLYPAYAETLELKPNEHGLLLLFPPFRAGSLEVQSRWLVDP